MEWLANMFGSDLAVGFYITATVILVPMAIYFIRIGDERERIVGGIILIFYGLLTLVILGLVGQQFMGNGMNVLAVLIILLCLLIYLGPGKDIVKLKEKSELK